MCNTHNESEFYSAGADGMVVKWRVDEPDGELLIKFPYPVYSLLLYKNYLLCGGNNGMLTIVDIESKQIVNQIQIHAHAIFDIQFWNHHFLLAQANGMLTLLNEHFVFHKDIHISSKSLRKILPVDESIYVTGSEAIIWKLNTGFKIESEKIVHNQSVFAMDYHVEKKILLSGGRDAVIKLWQNFEEIKMINAHWYPINHIAFNESQQYFSTCSLDKTIKIWDAENFELLKVIDNEKYPAHKSSVNKILWIGINRFISCSDDRMLMCFEIQQ